MSVQDAISLFERKQIDQTVDGQKNSVTESSTNTKAVLRRWSSGMSESQKSMSHDTTERITSENNAEDEETQRSAEVKSEAVPASENHDMVDSEVFEESKNVALSPSEDEVQVCQTEDTGEKLDSAEWSRKKEEELNKMLMKFAEYNMSNKNTEPDNNKNRVPRLRQSAGLNGNHKERKDEKLTREKSVKRVEKQPVIGAKQRVPDKPKPEKTSVKASDVGKKLPVSRAPNVNKNSPVSSNSKKELSKPAVPKKAPSTKSSPLPATRKSWPSTPSPRVAGTLPTKSPTITPPSVTSVPRQKSQSPAPRQKPQSPGSVPRPSPKLEKPQLQQKDVKKQQLDTKKSLKKVDDSKSHVVPKGGKTIKAKTVTEAPEEKAAVAAVSPAKAVVRKKVAKKSSVVPLEVKSSVRKVSEKSPAKNSGQKKEASPQKKEALSRSEDPIVVGENVVTVTSDTILPAESQELEIQDGHLELGTETETGKPENGIEKENSVAAMVQGDEVGEGKAESPANIQIHPAQESVISPAAWEESNQQDTAVPVDDSCTSTLVDPVAVASSETRVRHSLSQMLLEESSEPDIIEWGNAEHPPSMVYQKDAPKGLKRLLKFARKNKETNGAAWGSPYTSEGEDDGDEYRNLGKRNSDSLLKVALHSNYAEGFLSDSEPHSARSNSSNNSTRSSNKFQEGHASSKGTRSFFSLSAFRGKN
ncbi:Otogelin [Bienertia sinuspersici]